MRDVPWQDIFKLIASAAVGESCGWVQVGIDAYIPHRKYQVKPQSSPWVFCSYQQNKFSEFKVKFRQASSHSKRVLEATKLAFANKTKESITSQKLGSQDFWQIANSVISKSKSAIPPFSGLDMLFSASDKVKLFAKNFCKNSNLNDSGISLLVFPSRTNLKLHNISATPNMVKRVRTNCDLSQASGPDCNPVVVVLKNCELELSNILAELFNMCLVESCFPDCRKVPSVFPAIKNFGERCTAKNYHPVSLLSMVSKVLEKVVNNRLFAHLEKCGLYSDFQYGFRSFQSTADLLTVISDRIELPLEL